MTARSLRAAALLLVLAPLPAAPQTPPATEPAAPPAGAPRLAIAFFSAGFLAEVAARIQTERLETERLTEAYLQEKTGLIWTRTDNGTDLDWFAAGEYCRDLELGDWTDWRLPSIEELEALHDRRSVATYKVPSGFRLTGCCPWSTSRSGDGSAWNFSFRYRKRFSGSVNYSYELRALCVRPASPAEILFFEQAQEEAKKLEKRLPRPRRTRRRPRS